MKILFAGDFSVQDRAVSLFRDTQKAIGTFGQISKICKQHDLSIVNFESPVTDANIGILKDGPCIKNPKNAIKVLKDTGFGLFTLANNHLKDYGVEGIRDTFKALREHNVDYCGAGQNIEAARKPYIFEKNGIKLGILNVCENESSIATETEAGSNPITEIDLFYDIQNLRPLVDFLAVVIHGGREHYQLPTPRMKKLYHFIVDLGADLVVNHHQHCFSGFEVYKGKHVFYGLGNFYFDNPNKRKCSWNKGYLLSVELCNNNINCELIPFTQCDSVPDIQLDSYDSIEDSINTLNEIILDDVKLVESYKVMVSKELPLS